GVSAYSRGQPRGSVLRRTGPLSHQRKMHPDGHAVADVRLFSDRVCLHGERHVCSVRKCSGSSKSYGRENATDKSKQFLTALHAPAPYYGVTPPIRQTSFHSAGVTGCTDRRDSFTSAMSFSRGSARTAVSVTGVSNGVRALTSTTTHGSPSLAVGS